MVFNPGDPHAANQAPTTVPATPTDLITTVALGPVDQARGVIASLGLRPFRVFLVRITYAGPGHGKGNATDVTFDEILPVPKVRPVSEFRLAQSSGLGLKPGAVTVEKITRARRREELMGQAQLGPNPSPNVRVFWGLQPRGQIYMGVFERATDPRLESFGWSIVLNSLNAQIKGVGIT